MEWDRRRRGIGKGTTHPWPEAWKKSHWSWWTLSSGLSKESLCVGSYFSTRYVIIASDSLRLQSASD